jgi:hypothetical protein
LHHGPQLTYNCNIFQPTFPAEFRYPFSEWRAGHEQQHFGYLNFLIGWLLNHMGTVQHLLLQIQ